MTLPKISRNAHAIALDKTCELAESSAQVYASLSEMAVDSDVATRLFACARARAQMANDLIVARQESGDLPVNRRPGKRILQTTAMKLDKLVDNTEAMYHSLRDMDLEVRDAAQEALRNEKESIVIEALQSLVLSLEEASQSFDAAT